MNGRLAPEETGEYSDILRKIDTLVELRKGEKAARDIRNNSIMMGVYGAGIGGLVRKVSPNAVERMPTIYKAAYVGSTMALPAVAAILAQRKLQGYRERINNMVGDGVTSVRDSDVALIKTLVGNSATPRNNNVYANSLDRSEIVKKSWKTRRSKYGSSGKSYGS